MTRPTFNTERVVAVLMLAASLVYLLQFVRRGWVPHDEGLLGQTAERVLRGDMPHVDYEEPYTGALAWLYAGLFRVAGVDLVNIRWLLFGGASVATGLVYAILRRYLRPVGAATATWIALAWSFPNYFAGLPSWWVLICALLGVWALIRYVETDQLRYVALAGLSVGIAFVIKQTGAYLFPPLIMAILADGTLTPPTPDVHRSDRWLRSVVALCALGFATVMLRSGLRAAEILYLLVPVAASCAALLLRYHTQGAAARRTRWNAIVLASAGAALPCAILLIPYVANGFFSQFVNGVIVLPQRRLTFTSLPMLSAALLLFGVWIIACMLPTPRSLTAAQSRVLGLARWVFAIALALLSLWSLIAYHAVWQSSRSAAALLPPVALWLLARERVEATKERRLLFITCSMLAWASLVQFPFAAPVYFCYVAPLAVVAGVAVLAGGGWIQRPGLAPWVALVLFFAVVSLHRGYVDVVGLRHEPRRLDVPLDLDRAHLYVSASEAERYRRVTSLVVQHLKGGELLAGPDSPELYFLADRFSPSGTIYDFVSEGSFGRSTFDRSRWTGADVVVVNHSPIFSSEVRPDVMSELRREFPKGGLASAFEVRWR